MYKKVANYMRAHPSYNSFVHLSIGLGAGILITYPYIDHPVRLGTTLIALGLIGHLYPLLKK